MADVSTLSLTLYWLAVGLGAFFLYGLCVVTIRRRLAKLRLSHQAGLIGRDYIVRGIIGAIGTALVLVTCLCALFLPNRLIATLFGTTLLVLVPTVFLADAIYLFRRVHGAGR